MIEIRNTVKSVADKEKWAARRTSFVAKVHATKVVWFPPEPVKEGTKAASSAKKATRKTAKGANKKAAGTAGKTRGTAKKTVSAAKKSTRGTKRAASKA
jgi:hypothetical protein